MSLLDKSTRREFLVATSSAALGAAASSAGSQPCSPVSNAPAPVITENSVHVRPASLRGCGFPSAGYARDAGWLAIAPGLIGVGVRDLLRREWPTGGSFAFRPK
jgi:hypothetical protein